MQTTRFNYALALAHTLAKTIRANGKMERENFTDRGGMDRFNAKEFASTVAPLIKSYLLSPVKL